MIQDRGSGILLHITSLPSKFGIGDLGPEAFRFVNFLQQSGQQYWQVLPLNPTEAGSSFSPYSSPSAFAGNIWLISPEELVKDGLLAEDDITTGHAFPEETADFETAIAFKEIVLDKAYRNFLEGWSSLHNEFRIFNQKEGWWLNDYALFMVLRQQNGGRSWIHWEESLRDRLPEALAAAAEKHEYQFNKERFRQFIFFRQWEKLLNHCHEKGIKVFGDLPFYVDHNSADVWTFPGYFKLNQWGEPFALSGVPPDYFSDDGQLWGSPVYDWEKLQADGFSWWMQRLSQNLRLFDLLRLDHFRAFSACWEVPSGERTAKNGQWVKTPGHSFFDTVKQYFPHMPFIAEDLGEIDQPVRDLKADYLLPGMKVLQFAFFSDMPENAFILHNHDENSVVYTGTHDNNTSRGWYENEAPPDVKERISKYLYRGITRKNISKILIRFAMMSVSKLVIIPMQDYLNLGEKAMMNKPSTSDGNWKWRVKTNALSLELAEEILEITHIYGRKLLNK